MNSPTALLRPPTDTSTSIQTGTAETKPAEDTPVWRALLALRAAVKDIALNIRSSDINGAPRAPEIQSVAFQVFGDELNLRVNPGPAELRSNDVCAVFGPAASPRIPDSGTLFEISGPGWATLCQASRSFNARELEQLGLYLPYCFAGFFATARKRSLTVSHFAQSLDGQIATHTGDSRWIGNRANLIHAHRMRALCDAVLVGRGTLEADAPRLNVRHVSGPDPRRVFLGQCAVNAPDWSFRTASCSSSPDADCEFEDCADLLEELYRRGVMSVYVEGGARTTSQFLLEDALDVVQLHIAPMLVGSGNSAFALPGVERIRDAKFFPRHRYVPIGDHIMFLGERSTLPGNAVDADAASEAIP